MSCTPGLSCPTVLALVSGPCPPATNHSAPALQPHLRSSSLPLTGRESRWGRTRLGRAVSCLAPSYLPCRHQQHPGGHCPGCLAAGRRPDGGHRGPDPRSAAPGAGAHHRYATAPGGRGVTGTFPRASRGSPGLIARYCAAPSHGWSFLFITLTFSGGLQLAMFLPLGAPTECHSLGCMFHVC